MEPLSAVMIRLVGSLIDLNHPGHYLHWGFIQLSVANAVLILSDDRGVRRGDLDPLPSARGWPMTIDAHDRIEVPGGTDVAAGLPEDADQLSAKLRRAGVEALPPERLMPDRQPAYVASWIYVFGVITICALAIVILTGIVLAIFGPTWWHVSSTGLFVNSLHLWSVEVFFFAMVVHLWGKFFMAAWRGRRRATWITGVVSFVVSVGAAFTGYLSQQNFDSQWISTQAKDGINSTGAGAIFNVTNFGQMLMWHIVLLASRPSSSWSQGTSCWSAGAASSHRSRHRAPPPRRRGPRAGSRRVMSR